MDYPHDTNHNVLTAILLFIGFISNLISHAIQDYDIIFKLLSLAAVGLGVVVNLDKAVKVVWRYFVGIYQWIKKI